tara:strand:+ start:102 stop:452 length:351 start_codon:yes stop_codon:yes gene_type:complete
MAFKMKYGKGGFPYKTHLNRHVQGHDPLTQNIKDTRDLSDEDYYALKEKHEKKSRNIGPVESPEMIEKKKEIAREEAVGPSGTIFDATEAEWEKDRQEKVDLQDALGYEKDARIGA